MMLWIALFYATIDSIDYPWCVVEMSDGTLCEAHISWISGEIVEGALVVVERCE